MGAGKDGWVEVWWAPVVYQRWQQLGASAEAIAPAQLLERGGRRGLRYEVNSAKGDPSLADPARAQGHGVVDGGFVVRSASGEVRITELEGVLRGERLSGRCMVNGVDTGMQPVFTHRAAQNLLTILPGLLGEPPQLRVSNVPVYPTPEALEMFETYLPSSGGPRLTTNTVIAYLTAEGRYFPPGR